jgi:hypothetical protein
MTGFDLQMRLSTIAWSGLAHGVGSFVLARGFADIHHTDARTAQ